MIGFILGGLLLLMLTACASGPRQYLDASHKPPADQQRDTVECAAIASQAAQGAGGFWTDASLRNAAYMQAREQYLATCLQSRGWIWKTGY